MRVTPASTIISNPLGFFASPSRQSNCKRWPTLEVLLFYSLVNDITHQTLSDFGSILKESPSSVSKKNVLCMYATDCVTHVIFDVFAEVFPVTIIASSQSLDIFELLTLAKIKMYVLNGCNINFCGLEPR